jgi:CRP-like cAMP-binding protein
MAGATETTRPPKLGKVHRDGHRLRDPSSMHEQARLFASFRPGQEGGALVRRRRRGLGTADDPAGLRPRPVLAVADVRVHRGGQCHRRRRGLQRAAAGNPAPLHGARFYLIGDGRARACRDGGQLREMGPGDSFGEIALLRRIPRTATVTAITRLEVRILAREEFLAAVTGNPESVQSADEVVSTRLLAAAGRVH